ncbi:amino acid adenylation domain-containing protein [Streptomyces albus]|uniref:amino acid adenylation domain-containing protein n=1 Tax=Streptomyces albus TaxID=1888 RepID=UPI00340AD074
MRLWNVESPSFSTTVQARRYPSGDRDVVGRVRRAVTRTPDKVAYRFLGDGERETDRLTYAELDRLASSGAVVIKEHCAPGDRVLLVCRPGLEFAVAFLATLYAGCTAVPVAPPGLTVATSTSLAAIARDADPALVVRQGTETPPGLAEPAETVDYESLLRGDPDAWAAPALRPEDLAFLQYTSGSTGAPKGVMVSHGNLLANQAQIQRVFQGGPDDVIVSWLPVHHDMGLVGGLLHALYLGAGAVLMPPTAFLRDPGRWLRAITTYRGTISPAPDFAYALCVDAVDRAGTARTAARENACETVQHASAPLDLRSWRVACNGSEPVRAETLRRFTETFAPYGFDGRAFCPSYGMAEATLLISGDGGGEEPRTEVFGTRRHELVSCGPWQTDSLVVVSGNTPVEEGEEGEICVAGANIAPGYWRAPQTTEESFGLRLEGRRYLRTGDLGRVKDGHLYVTGRAKDVVVVRGRNHHAADIEATIQAVDPRLVTAAGAVFDTARGPVAVQAVRRANGDLSELENAVRAAVAGVHGVVLADCVLVPSASVPRTTSGKVRRSACRAAYLDGSLPRRNPPRAGSEVAGTGPGHRLARAAAGVLGVPEGSLPGDVPLTALGLDSLGAIRLAQQLHDDLGLDVPQGRLLAGATIGGLTAELGTRGLETAAIPSREARPPRPVPPGGMTYGQQALAYLTAATPDGPKDYTIARAFTLPADTGTEALAEALRRCVSRHEQLRSRFPRDGEGFRHEVLPVTAHPWCTVETVTEQETLRERAEALLEEPLDIETGPLLDVVVLRPPSGPAILVVRVSHLVADLHSLALLTREWAVLYDALRHGTRARLPRPASWRAVLEQEEARLAEPQVREAAAQWARRLADLEPPDWPVVPGACETRHGGHAVALDLDERTTARVMAVAARESTTPFAVLLGCLGLFVAELTGRRDLAVGVPLAVRDDAETHDAVGYLVNTLPLPLSLPVGTKLRQAAAEAARALLHGMDHARIPLSVITSRLQRPRAAPGSHFSVMCDWVDDPSAETSGFGAAALDLPHDGIAAGGLRLGPWRAGAPRPHADLDVAFTRNGRRIAGRFAVDAAAIDTGTAQIMAECFTDFVRRALADPDGNVGLTGPAAPASVLPPAVPRTPPVTLGALFREQVSSRPDAPALTAPGLRWNYADLGARVEATAAVLPALDGAAPHSTPLVGLHLDDAVDFAVAALAALVRGYGIVPLPTDTPAQHLAFMAEDAGVGVVVHSPSHTDVTAWAPEAVCVPLPGRDANTVRRAGGGVSGPDKPDAVAYVVYTSGTTGRPKGVAIRHSEVHPLLAWQVEGLGAGPGMRLAQTLALSFDFGLQELFTTLLWGGTLCVPAPAERHSATGYGQFLRRDGVNTLFATPTFLRELVQEKVRMEGLGLLVLGGETLTPAAVRAALPLLSPSCRVINGYGPTEASINCTMHTVDTARLDSAETLPVGAATGASRVYVMGPGGDPLPERIVGEVCVGGPGVARGYLNRPAETERAFIPDPVAADGSLMYRTGDLGFLRSGELHLVGRRDAQVKVRGYRVEPGGIEAVLRSLPQVQDAAVLVDRSGPAVRLVAFVIPAGAEEGAPDTAAAETAWRTALADRLSPHLLPQRIVRVDAFPLTRHGKLDEATLLSRVPPPAPAASHTSAGTRNVTATVAEVWRNVLGVQEIGIDTNFFEAGGHSLAVGAVVSQLADRLGTGELPFHLVFEYPTVRLLAQHIERLLAERPEAGPPPAVPPPTRPLGGPRRARGRQRALSHREQRDPRSPQ